MYDEISLEMVDNDNFDSDTDNETNNLIFEINPNNSNWDKSIMMLMMLMSEGE